MRAHENPYRISCVESLGFRGRESVARLVAEVVSMGYRGAIVGQEGSGKSTLLREIGESLAEDGCRVRIVRFDDRAALAQAIFDRDTVWLIDGAERIVSPLRVALARLVRRIVMTSHSSTAGLPLVTRCATNLTLFSDLLADLGGPPLTSEDAETVFRRSGGNLRLAFRSLYDAAAHDFVGAFRAR
jgi:hypothetical protein